MSPQYHVVFDKDVTTVPYIEAVTIPPNWENIAKHSSEMSTTSDVDLEDTWLNGTPKMGALDQISDPFSVMTDHHKLRKTTNPGSPTSKQNSETPATADSKGDSSPLF